MTGAGQGVAGLRSQVRQAVEASSLRAVAEEIGMSWSGLRSFLEGTTPHPSTIAKLLAWSGTKRTASPSRRDMLSAIEVMADYIEGVPSPEGRRKRLLGVLSALTERVGPDLARELQRALRDLK